MFVEFNIIISPITIHSFFIIIVHGVFIMVCFGSEEQYARWLVRWLVRWLARWLVRWLVLNMSCKLITTRVCWLHVLLINHNSWTDLVTSQPLGEEIYSCCGELALARGGKPYTGQSFDWPPYVSANRKALEHPSFILPSLYLSIHLFSCCGSVSDKLCYIVHGPVYFIFHFKKHWFTWWLCPSYSG
jgi:energy-coupling factor transporter transmembrane protein EcfT